jgi:phage tail-like protein
MDANGSRYHALVTQRDWEACASEHLSWQRDQFALRPLLFEFKVSGGTAAPEPGSREGGVFDAFGNLYSLSPDGRRILVRSTGSGLLSDFWPLAAPGGGDVEGLGAPATPAPSGDFKPRLPAGPRPVTVLDALTLTTGHYLVAASQAAAGLLIFDLHGAGPPLFQPWPGMPAPESLLALQDGGLALLAGGWLHRVGPDLRPCVARPSGGTAFHPEPAATPGEPPCRLDLRPTATGTVNACAALPDCRFLVLAGSDAALTLGVIDWAGVLTPVSLEAATLNAAIQAASADGGAVLLSARSLLVEWPAGGEGFAVVVLAASGDQAFRFGATWSSAGLQLTLLRDFIPLRRYAGGGLAALARGQVLHRFASARAFYFTPAAWVPLLKLPRPRCEREGWLEGPVWDSATPDCVWHRVALDARRPPGSRVSLQSRASDDRAGLALQPWLDEPMLLPHPGGPELPWRTLDLCEGETLTCLLQAARGQWLQLRLSFSGDGQQSPGVAALRAWYPRFSYLKEYLPAVYRSDPPSSRFTERFLALFEGEFTRWEDRIAAAQLLLDARTAPPETLAWLANWLALVFDGSTPPQRRRALLRHAFRSHARRGTVPGLLLAATLAWEPESVDVEPFLADPEGLPERVHGLRLQELFGLTAPLPASAWRPAQGRAALLDALKGDAALLATPARVPVLQAALGFVPRSAQEDAGLPLVCAPLRQRWQDFLARRWRRIAALNAAWGSAFKGFDDIACVSAVPASAAELSDWYRFEARVIRGLANAHRFRVVLPLPGDALLDLDDLNRRRAAVARAIERDKPAHTVAEIRFGFELFRVGEARLGQDTRLELGLTRRPGLAALASRSIWPPMLVGERDLGGAELTNPRPLPPPDRVGLDR